MVWCHFPDALELKPALKARPALVRRVLKNPDNGAIAVEVAYGTSTLKPGLQNQIVVSHPRDLEEAGLVKATRFDLELTKILPWCHEFFAELNAGDGPIIGRMSAVVRLEQVVPIADKMRKAKVAAMKAAAEKAAAESVPEIVVEPAALAPSAQIGNADVSQTGAVAKPP